MQKILKSNKTKEAGMDESYENWRKVISIPEEIDGDPFYEKRPPVWPTLRDIKPITMKVLDVREDADYENE